LITFDIKDLYINIPVSETLNIVKTKLLQNNDTQIAQQILTLLKEVLSQNYFMFQQRQMDTRTRYFHGFPDIWHNSINIVTVLQRQKQKTPTRHKKPSILHKIRRRYLNRIRHDKSQFTHHQHIHKQYTQKHQT